ncbi:MAG: T9SS type A sorting domain-containing protein [Bacteroidota bacterium]
MNIITEIASITQGLRAKSFLLVLLVGALISVKPGQTQTVHKVQFPKKDICNTHAGCRPAPIDLRFPNTEHLVDARALQLSIDLQDDGSIDQVHDGLAIKEMIPFGTHRLIWTADGKEWAQLIEVKDCLPPEARCIQGRSIDLTAEEKQYTLWVNDLNQLSVDNCAVVDMRLTLSQQGTAPSLPAFDHLQFTCDDLGKKQVDLWVRDAAGQWDYCSAPIWITNTDGSCASSKEIEKRQQDLETYTVPSSPLAPVLKQNQPNPFRESTQIGFSLLASGKVRLSISDLSGQIVKAIEGDYVKGHHEIIIKKADLPASGLYFYQLETAQGTTVKRMQYID